MRNYQTTDFNLNIYSKFKIMGTNLTELLFQFKYLLKLLNGEQEFKWNHQN